MPLPLMALAAGAGILGKVFGGASRGAANERAGQNNFAQNQNQQDLQRFGIQQNTRTNLSGLQERATMDRAEMGLRAPNMRMRQAILGSLIQNMQTAKITPPAGVRMGTMTGGIDPSRLLNAGARAGGGEMQRQALLALLNKSDVPADTDYTNSGTVAPPKGAGFKSAGKLESILSVLGLLGSAAGGAGEAASAFKSAKTPTPFGAGTGY